MPEHLSQFLGADVYVLLVVAAVTESSFYRFVERVDNGGRENQTTTTNTP